MKYDGLIFNTRTLVSIDMILNSDAIRGWLIIIAMIFIISKISGGGESQNETIATISSNSEKQQRTYVVVNAELPFDLYHHDLDKIDALLINGEKQSNTIAESEKIEQLLQKINMLAEESIVNIAKENASADNRLLYSAFKKHGLKEQEINDFLSYLTKSK